MGMGHQITEEEYRRVRSILRAKARSLGVPEEELDDLVQETFYYAQKSLRSGRFDGKSSLDTWIVSIGKNRALKRFRSKRAAMRNAPETPISDVVEDRSQPALATTEPGPEEKTVDHFLLEQVKNSIEQLPEKLRQPLVLLSQGLNIKEIASALGISVKLVNSRLHEGRAKLRAIFDRPRPAVKS